MSIVLLAALFLGVVQSPSWSQGNAGSVEIQSQDLLQRARQAIAENKLDDAEKLIQQAETLKVQYSPLYPGYTPDRLRRDLDLARKSRGASQDPFAIRQTSANMPVPTAAPAAGLTPTSTGAIPTINNTAMLARKYLAQGRKCLQQGDLVQAEAMCQEAMKLKVAYMNNDDTPERLQRDIQAAMSRQNGTTEAVAANAVIPPLPQSSVAPQIAAINPPQATVNTATANTAPATTNVRKQSDQLLLSARLSLSTGDVQKARTQVASARVLNVSYGPKNDSPARVETDIAAYEKASAAYQQSNSDQNRKELARVLINQAQTLFYLARLDEAENLALNAQKLNASYSNFDKKPEDILTQVSQKRQSTARPANVADTNVASTVYQPNQDTTYNRQVADNQPTPAPVVPMVAAPIAPAAPAAGNVSIGVSYFNQGEAAMRAGDNKTAYEAFREAANYRDQLEPSMRLQLNDRLSQLQAISNTPVVGAPVNGNGLNPTVNMQNVQYGRIYNDLIQQTSKADGLKNTNPTEAVKVLNDARTMVEKAELDENSKARLLAQVDRQINEINAYAQQNGALIATEERNQQILTDNARAVELKNEKELKIEKLINEYNELIKQQRFAEAEIKAKQAYEIDPNDRVCIQVMTIAKTQRRLAEGLRIQSMKEAGFVTALNNAEEAAIPFDDNNPLVFPDAKRWEEITRLRAQTQDKGPYSDREREILTKLDIPVRLDFKNTPIQVVIEKLSDLAGINIYLDPNGLAAAGVSSDTVVDANFPNEIALKSALNLILRSKNLTYVVRNDVLEITSTDLSKGNTRQKVYNVADLVIPIPNFVPSANMGLAGAYRNALMNIGYGSNGANSPIMAPALAVASRDGANMNNNSVLGQSMDGSGIGVDTVTSRGGSQGSLGAGSGADFDQLIELITTTVAPSTWQEAGGEGTIAPFETNLSLVVSQTQEVHDQIVELLEQLRRLQDLQVTIEVRFVSLSDAFYERIGVDFNFNIKSDADGIVQVTSSTDPNTGTTTQSSAFTNSATVGLSAPGVFTANLDVPFQQNNYTAAIPQFGGYTAGDGASLGMAFLSDIEAYMFITAAQGDTRSNILQAPKVTLFNGQQAMVSDTQQSPFVMSVTPVVGDFAAAQQPVIVVLSEGTFLTVQAVVSNDRRFVRLTVVPFFSDITEVNTFQFTGSESTTTDSSSEGDAEQPVTKKDSSSTSSSRSGTSVQLPTFAYQTVTTTVSVPDGGTVLLGGIKRLKEGRDEKGTPILNKIPYISRLFKNVGIGRETESIMMMVTPRIIIQEEEEESLGVVTQ